MHTVSQLKTEKNKLISSIKKMESEIKKRDRNACILGAILFVFILCSIEFLCVKIYALSVIFLLFSVIIVYFIFSNVRKSYILSEEINQQKKDLCYIEEYITQIEQESKKKRLDR